MDPYVVDGRIGSVRRLEGTLIGRVGSGCRCWKGCIRRGFEGLDPDVNWKGWKGRRLEGLDLDVVAGRVGSVGDWKGWIRTSLLEELEGTLIGRAGREIDWKVVVDCRLFQLMLLLLLLIVPIDVVIAVVVAMDTKYKE